VNNDGDEEYGNKRKKWESGMDLFMDELEM
jgi:hypothetical protein